MATISRSWRKHLLRLGLMALCTLAPLCGGCTSDEQPAPEGSAIMGGVAASRTPAFRNLGKRADSPV